MTTLTSECYDGTVIRSLLTTNKDGAPVITIERILDPALVDEVAVFTMDVPLPPNTANPEDHLAFEHREQWRDYNERKLT